MPNTDYSYKVADLSSGFDTDVFLAEFAASSIATELLGVSTGVRDPDEQDPDDLHLLFADALATGEKTTLDGDATPPAVGSLLGDHAGAVSELDQSKAAKAAAIDGRTRDLIAEGFEYPSASGVYFSLSTKGQASLLGLEAARDDPAFTYPVNWNSKNDKAKQALADTTSAHGFFMTALGTVRGHLDGGTALKDDVRAAATVAEVDAILDNR